ncbi:hypothetical protein TrCOL_g8381 [Triparma columacea]|uniref:N-acetyltransferase domain-containing protein n=1 Tax=Triparma columacea TaxID=722753 RepID=A0A9W7GMS4_9STRA|nr:hypothetical protein TrCOL_g8381 [Triparma columacea]
MGRLEVTSGLQSRLSTTVSLHPEGKEGEDWDKTSVVACVYTGEGEVTASCEVRLQPTDGKIPFTSPLLDRIERNVGGAVGAVKGGGGGGSDVKPYICNLFTKPGYRSGGLGRTLVRLQWFLATEVWGYDECYLHVDKENDVARKLYEQEGWREVDTKWMPGWEGKASGIGYYGRVKESSKR